MLAGLKAKSFSNGRRYLHENVTAAVVICTDKDTFAYVYTPALENLYANPSDRARRR